MSSRVEDQLEGMTALLREQCKEAGLRTDGSSDVLVERWTNYCETRDLRAQVEKLSTRKRERIDDDDQYELNMELLDAAKSADVARVTAALDDGANVNYACSNKQRSALIHACRLQDDWDVASQIVELLVACGASVLQPEHKNVLPLHWAARRSSVKVVAILLKAGARVIADDSTQEVPLHYAARRSDEEGAKIMECLCSRGASGFPAVHTNWEGQVPLMVLAEHGTADMMRVYLSFSGYEPCGGDAGSRSALTLAARNIVHGAEIIQVLLDHHKDDNPDDGRGHPYGTPNMMGGDNAMAEALRYGNTAAVKALKRGLPLFKWPETSGTSAFSNGCGDPLGTADAVADCGISVVTGNIWHSHLYSMATPWVYLRRGVPDVPKVFAALKSYGYQNAWRWIGLEMPNVRLPGKGSTLLHLAAKNRAWAAIEALCDIWANPFLRDAKGRMPVDLVSHDQQIAVRLREYMQQGPRREVVRWYGPFFLARAHAWMCCVVHWRFSGVRFIPKDVALMVVRRVMALEHV
jgi:ankyrin repeat protein